jgi:hypothetical protein
VEAARRAAPGADGGKAPGPTAALRLRVGSHEKAKQSRQPEQYNPGPPEAMPAVVRGRVIPVSL